MHVHVRSSSTFARACEGIAWITFATYLAYSVVFHSSAWVERWRYHSVSVGADPGGGTDVDSGSASGTQHGDRGVDPETTWGE